ncbi:ATP-binding protein [Parageobacillus thermoglucosidasius]|uniref:ATP-binding protein n=1 Tax=Parageobacillus thermoglucosidasius TaxID=1426 RepID=UPI000E182E78|nr:ATP-binding protein [Parageobacillus thermoglucosidasius]RDE34152.1 ATP-binding protein [Parageobacillus thermoglucosidasius]
MEILINHRVISDSPYNGDNEDIFVFDDEELISQIKQEIINGTPTCFLVSGYRGVGKTSFIRRVEQDIKKENSKVVFIKLNVAKYESYSLLLRKIIREVYLSISETQDINELKKQNNEIITSLELLFERTFHEVLSSQKSSFKHETTSSVNIQINIKKLSVAILTLLIAALNIQFNLTDWFVNLKTNKYIDLILLGISALWVAIELFSVKNTINKNKTDFLEISRKTLYDDEIAEYQLNKTLKDLNTLGIQPVFIIDELDKIDENEKIEALIGELKPLMLSGLASFILVSGQNLYYKFHTAHILDDALIASIFSKTLHIPLWSTKKFFELFSKIVSDSNLANEKNIVNYVKSKILNSNRLPRRFLNLIRQDLVWKDKKAYIEVLEEDAQVYITDAKLLEIIDEIQENELLTLGYSEGIVDFFISQLHIWVQRMKLKGNSFFCKDDIYNLENDYKTTHPSWYFTKLNSLVISLLEKLVDSGLLEKKIEKSDDGEEILYFKWTEQASIKTEALIDEDDELKSRFLMNFIEFEKYLREIYQDIFKDNNSRFSITQMIKSLIEIELLPKRWVTDNQLNSIIRLRNKIVHGEIITSQELDLVQNYAFEINKIKAHLIEEYTYYVTKRHLEQYNYFTTKELSYDKNSKFLFDFVARNKSFNVPDVLFEVKVLNAPYSALRYHLYKYLEGLEEYNSHSGKYNYLVFIIYSQNGRKIYDKFKEQLERILLEEFPRLQGYILSYYNSEYRGDANQSRLKIFLEDIVKKIKN